MTVAEHPLLETLSLKQLEVLLAEQIIDLLRKDGPLTFSELVYRGGLTAIQQKVRVTISKLEDYGSHPGVIYQTADNRWAYGQACMRLAH